MESKQAGLVPKENYSAFMVAFVLAFNKLGQKRDKEGPPLKTDNRIFQPMLYRVRVKGDVGKAHINPRHLTELA